MKDTKKIAASRRKTIIIVAAAVAIILLAVALAYVLEYVRTTLYEDPVDDAKYYIRLVDGEYKMYKSDKKTPLSLTDDKEYFVTDSGTFVYIDPETGKATTMAVVDTDYNEVSVGETNLLALPYRDMESIRAIEVHNSTGTYTVHRYNYTANEIDDSAEFSLKGYPMLTLDEVGLPSLGVGAGRILTMRKLVSPSALTDEQKANIEEYRNLTYITKDDGTLDESEYGLAAEVRQKLDEESGELVDYNYEPAYFIVTTTAAANGGTPVKYKVIIGDELVTGGGYYIQVVEYTKAGEQKRDVVYIATSSLGTTLLARAEDFVVAQLSYPMTLSTYFDVKNFNLFEKGNKNPKLAFSYIPLEERENTAYSVNAYKFHGDLQDYVPATVTVNQSLAGIYEPSIVGIQKIFNSLYDMEPLVEYGFYTKTESDAGKVKYHENYDYMIVFDYSTEDLGTIRQSIMLVKAENGNYYAYTTVHDPKDNELVYAYDMIIEVAAYSFSFLEMEMHHWIEPSFFNTGIAFVDKIEISAPDYNATMNLIQGELGKDEELSADKLSISATEKYDGKTNSFTTFSEMTFVDKPTYDDKSKADIIWQITATDVRAYTYTRDEDGKLVYNKVSIGDSSWYEETNAMGQKVRALRGSIEAYDANGKEKQIWVRANEVIVKDIETGKSKTYVRYGTALFQQLYMSLLGNDIESSYEMSEAEEAALIANKDNWLLTFSVTIEGEKKEFSFYYLSPRKAYLTINGQGGFYVHMGRAEKNISDVQKFFNGEMINPNDLK